MAKSKTKTNSVGPLVAGDIKNAPYNPRNISPEQLETLGATMAAYGDISGIVLNVRTGNCVGGHQRLKHIDPQWKIVKHAQTDSTGTVAVGVIETPWGAFSYREVDWDDNKERGANLAANKVGGEWDFDAVGKLLSELDGKLDLNLTGFDPEEAEKLIADATQLPDASLPFEPVDDTTGGDSANSVAFKFGDFKTQVTRDTYEQFVAYVEANKKGKQETELMDAVLRKLLAASGKAK